MEARPPTERTSARHRGLYWLGGGGTLVIAAIVVLFRSRVATAPRPALDPLAAVPPGPAFVVTVDVSRLRQRGAAEGLLGKALGELDRERCGRWLAANVERVALAVPVTTTNDRSAPDTSALAVIATGHFNASAALDCAEIAVRQKHGEPVRTSIGGFTTVRDRAHPGEVAASDGVFVLSDGAYFRDILDGLNTTSPRPAASADADQRDRLHAELRRLVGRGAPIIATLVLQPSWLAVLLDDPDAERSPLAALRTAALRAEPATARDFDAELVLACDDADGCARLERFLTNFRADLALIAGPGATSFLANLGVSRRGAQIELKGRVPLDALDPLADSLAPSPPSARPPSTPSAVASVAPAPPAVAGPSLPARPR